MQNRIEQYQDTKKISLPKEAVDQKMVQDLARADDDGFAVAENNFGDQSTDKDSDCWSNLWQKIKTNASRFMK